MASLQGLDLPQRPASASQLPVSEQFLLVQFSPLLHLRKGTSRKFAIDHAGLDFDSDFKIAIDCMEMRGP
jgi:hypothetical protein